MSTSACIPVATVVSRHLDDAEALRLLRPVLVRRPDVNLQTLSRHDERLAASLDGLLMARDFGRDLCEIALELPNPGVIFTAGVLALQSGQPALLDKLLVMAEGLAPLGSGLMSAFGWVSAASLRGITKALLESPNAFRRDVGLTACVMHRVDPGAALDAAVADPASSVRATVIAGKLGRVDLLPACLARLSHADVPQRLEAAGAALLLGDRQRSIEYLHGAARTVGNDQAAAAVLLLEAVSSAHARTLLDELAKAGAPPRVLIRGIGAVGDPHYVPWLLKQMSDPLLARVAGESFSTITGLELARAEFERAPPDSFQVGPTDSPDDDDVALDEDDGLPWPDAEKVEGWWRAHGGRFVAGQRFFVGDLAGAAHCLQVLRVGGQRQRAAAARHLSLLKPGTRLFPTAAPAWRQRRWLDEMGA